MSSARRNLRAVLLIAVAAGLLAPATVARAEPSVAEIQQQITTQSTKLTQIVEEYNRAREELKATKETSAKLEEKLAPLLDDLAQAQIGIDELAVTAYKTGDMAMVSSLFGASSTAMLFDRLNVLDQVAKAQQEQLASYVAARDSYQQRQQELDDLRADQEARSAALEKKKDKIEADLEKLFELRRVAYGREQEAANAAATAAARASAPSVSGKAGIAVQFAYDALGTPYQWAASGPNGYDCSGLTLAAWRAAGVSLPHSAAMQWDQVARISRADLAPGDLVFYNGLGHVGIYVGNNKIIHSPTFGEVVKIGSVDIMTPYGYGRVRI